jgi:hypothetical protein
MADVQNFNESLTICGDLSDWELSLVGGGVIRLRAHGYSKEHEEYRFSMLMDGQPRFIVEVFRIPYRLVSKVRGGWKISQDWNLDWADELKP